MFLHVSEKVDKCVKKVDEYETGTGVCNDCVSVCGSHVRDCVRIEKVWGRWRE